MKRYLIIAGLLFGMSGLCAVAQTSTTPGVPAPNDHDQPTPQATAPDNQGNPDRAGSDQQPSAETPRQDRDGNDNYNADRDRQDQSSDSARRDRDSDRDQAQPDRAHQAPQAEGQEPDDRSDRNYVGTDAYRKEIQMALRRDSLNNVSVNDTASRIELSGTVLSPQQHDEAMRIAQSYAHGREVVDRIQISR